MLTAVVAAGLAGLVVSMPSVLTALTVLGAGYLVWLGLATLVRPAVPQFATQGIDQGRSWAGRAVRGAGNSGLNPKALLLFLALLPQFATHGAAWPFAAQIALLGAVHTANCTVVYSGVGATARRVLRARPAVARAVSRCSGTAMIAIGVALAEERLLR